MMLSFSKAAPLGRACAIGWLVIVVGCAGSETGPAPPTGTTLPIEGTSAATIPAADAVETNTPATPPSASAASPGAVAGRLPTDFAWKEPTFGCSAGATCDVPYFSSPGGRIAGAPIAIDTSDLGAGATERFPHEPAIELIGVVLSGSVDVTPIEAKGPAPLKGLGVWSVFRAPGGGVAITATGAASARVVHVYVVRKGRGAVTAYMTDPESPTQAKIKTTFKREQPPSSVDLTKQTDLSWGGGAFHARIGWEDAGAPAVVSSLVFSKDAAVAEHVHEKEWECVLVLTGKGTLTLAGSPKSLSPGMMECVPPSTKHAWKGEGTDPFVAVQIYTPPGPEQRFKKLANP